MPGERTLEVLPKIGGLDDPPTRALLMRMLSAADVAPSLEEVAADYANSPNLLEAYLRFATDLALQQVRMDSCMLITRWIRGYQSSAGDCW